MAEKNIFEKIIAGDIPAETVYEDDTVLAFLDIKPVNPGHTLVIPKESFRNIFDTPDEILGHMMSVAKAIAHAQKNQLQADGVNIIMNNEADAGQIVFHPHLHVIPRFAGDGYDGWHGTEPYQEGEAQAIAKQLTSFFDDQDSTA